MQEKPEAGTQAGPAELDDADLLDELSWLWPPDDLHDPEAWNTYWRNQLKHGLAPGLVDMFCRTDELIAAFRANDLRTVLCVGSGLSFEPCNLNVAGFDTTVLDLSDRAMWAVDRVCASATGTSPRCVAGDLTDPTVCPGPYDAIVERRTLQLFPEADRPHAIEAVANRLAPRGIFFSHCHDPAWRPPSKPRHWTQAWFEKAGWEIWRQPPQTLRTRAAWLFTSTG
jgi:hypothetical protein